MNRYQRCRMRRQASHDDRTSGFRCTRCGSLLATVAAWLLHRRACPGRK
jgi:hypothetical protein